MFDNVVGSVKFGVATAILIVSIANLQPAWSIELSRYLFYSSSKESTALADAAVKARVTTTLFVEHRAKINRISNAAVKSTDGVYVFRNIKICS